MAQIEQSDKGGKKKKGAQKKMQIHVDFTPMVDMNMLLITFFMLCTTMIKSQTLSIALPTNDDNLKEEQKSQAKQSEALTLIIDAQRKADGTPVKDHNEGTVYYFQGKPPVVKNGQFEWDQESSGQILKKNFDASDAAQGIRAILQERNKDVLKKINEQKERWRNKEITEEQFQEESKKISNDSTLTRPVVVIKATGDAPWRSVIAALDEMGINSISRYSIDRINGVDSQLINLKPL